MAIIQSNNMPKKNNNEINKQKRVLYLEDEPFIAKSLAVNLELFGWDVKLVSDIDAFFNELESSHFDNLILDIMIPVPNSNGCFTEREISQMDDGMNTGVVLAKKVWSKDEYRDLPILFLSAKKDPRGEDPTLSSPKCGYLRKPELAKTVNDKLNELLSHVSNERDKG